MRLPFHPLHTRELMMRFAHTNSGKNYEFPSKPHTFHYVFITEIQPKEDLLRPGLPSSRLRPAACKSQCGLIVSVLVRVWGTGLLTHHWWDIT